MVEKGYRDDFWWVHPGVLAAAFSHPFGDLWASRETGIPNIVLDLHQNPFRRGKQGGEGLNVPVEGVPVARLGKGLIPRGPASQPPALGLMRGPPRGAAAREHGCCRVCAATTPGGRGVGVAGGGVGGPWEALMEG